MKTFLFGLFVLLAGGFAYGKFMEHIFKPDDRETPAVAKQDGVDYVPIPLWKNALINLLNIAGTGPIIGPIQGILFGPLAFITIPIGNVIGGAVHDYFNGMLCMREGGVQMPELVRRYCGKKTAAVYRIIFCVMLILVGTVFIYTPGDIACTQVFGFSGAASDPKTWLVYGLIFVYYLAATVFPVDKIIGKLYPIFGAVLIISSVAILFSLLTGNFPLIELNGAWNTWAFDYYAYYKEMHFVPVFFVTVACGILSGFHSSQTSLVARTVEKEKHGFIVFYFMMILEGFIAMIWAAGAMSIYNLGLQEADASLATQTIGVICRTMMGPVGSVLALLGVIILPITSGDTSLRAVRLTITEEFNIDQSKAIKRLGVSSVIFLFAAVILVWAKTNADGFAKLWRYFGFCNQSISLFAFAACSKWMFRTGRKKFVWVPLIPGTFYAFVVSSYICNAKIGFSFPWGASYQAGFAFAVSYLAICIARGIQAEKAAKA